MNKFLAVLSIAFAANFATALPISARLTDEVVQGNKKICIYSDGSTKTISAWGVCPQLN